MHSPLSGKSHDCAATEHAPVLAVATKYYRDLMCPAVGLQLESVEPAQGQLGGREPNRQKVGRAELGIKLNNSIPQEVRPSRPLTSLTRAVTIAARVCVDSVDCLLAATGSAGMNVPGSR